MNTNYLFNVRTWYEGFYTSQLELFEAAKKGLIEMNVSARTYGSDYTFTTKEGVGIASFYKDATFGFCSQAYGVKVPNPIDMFPAVRKEHDQWCVRLTNIQAMGDKVKAINLSLSGINPDTDAAVNLLAERDDLEIKISLLISQK